MYEIRVYMCVYLYTHRVCECVYLSIYLSIFIYINRNTILWIKEQTLYLFTEESSPHWFPMPKFSTGQCTESRMSPVHVGLHQKRGILDLKPGAYIGSWDI